MRGSKTGRNVKNKDALSPDAAGNFHTSKLFSDFDHKIGSETRSTSSRLSQPS